MYTRLLLSSLVPAATDGRLTVLLQNSPFNPNLKTTTGRCKSLLAWAILNDRTNCARYLIAMGADVDALDSKDRGPLHEACSRGNVECVNLLLQAGAECNKRLVEGATAPLSIACRHGHAKCVQALLDAGAQPTIGLYLSAGDEAVFEACENRHVDCLRLLM